MIGYRFLLPAEEEMTEASLFYERAMSALGGSFLDEVVRIIDILREHPELGQPVGADSEGRYFTVFRSK